MRIALQNGGSTYWLAGEPGVAESVHSSVRDYALNGDRQIDVANVVRADFTRQFDRGQQPNVVTFGTTRTFTTADLCFLYTLDYLDNIERILALTNILLGEQVLDDDGFAVDMDEEQKKKLDYFRDFFMELLIQLAPPRYQYTETTLAVKLDLAQSFDATGVLQSSPMAYGVVDWDAWLVFTDLDVEEAANPTDGDVTNDFDDLLGTRITATLAANRADIRVNDGDLFTMDYQWRIMPRNLMYERNR